MIPFGQFAPDRSSLDPDASDSIRNVIPRSNSYGPFPSPVDVSGPLPAQPLGAVLARASNGTYRIFAGTAESLFEYVAANHNPELDGNGEYVLDGNGKRIYATFADTGWVDVSQIATTYGAIDGVGWQFVQFGDLLFATNGVDPVQKFNLLSGTEFEDVGGSPPKANYIGVVGDFLVLGATDTAGPQSIHWSGVNDPEWWRVGQRGCDTQTFPEGGPVVGIRGFERGGVIFQDNAIREMNAALETPMIFTFRKVDDTKTIVAARSIVAAGGSVFYTARNGFFRYGEPPVPIGGERVDRYFQASADPLTLYITQGTADPLQNLVYWRFRTSSLSDPTMTDRVLIYNYALDRWSIAEVVLSWIFGAVTPPTSLDDITGYTLDNLPISLDSPYWDGGTPMVAGLDEDFNLVFFSGAPLEAVLQTGDVALAGQQRAFIRGFRLSGDVEMVSGRIGTRARSGAARTWGASAQIQRTGLIPARANGRLARFEITIPAGETWAHVHGIEPDSQGSGRQ